MRAVRALRIIALRLHFDVDPRKIAQHFGNARNRGNRKIFDEHDGTIWFGSRHVIEVCVGDAAMVKQMLPEHRLRHAGDLRDSRELALWIGNLRRNEREHERRPAARDDDAIAIGDQSARRGDRNQTYLICLRGGAIVRSIEDLHFDKTREERERLRARSNAMNPPNRHDRTRPLRTARALSAVHRCTAIRRTINIAATISATLSTAEKSAS